MPSSAITSDASQQHYFYLEQIKVSSRSGTITVFYVETNPVKSIGYG